MRLVLSATTAAAALYGAVVLFGPGPSSPLALSEGNVRQPVPVHVSVHSRAAQGPASRGPQPSPGPARHETRVAPAVRRAIAVPQRRTALAAKPIESSKLSRAPAAPTPQSTPTTQKTALTPATAIPPSPPAPVVVPVLPAIESPEPVLAAVDLPAMPAPLPLP